MSAAWFTRRKARLSSSDMILWRQARFGDANGDDGKVWSAFFFSPDVLTWPYYDQADDDEDAEDIPESVFGSVFAASAPAASIISGFWEGPDADDETDADDASAGALYDPPAAAPVDVITALADVDSDDDEDEVTVDGTATFTPPLNDRIAVADSTDDEPDDDEVAEAVGTANIIGGAFIAEFAAEWPDDEDEDDDLLDATGTAQIDGGAPVVDSVFAVDADDDEDDLPEAITGIFAIAAALSGIEFQAFWAEEDDEDEDSFDTLAGIFSAAAPVSALEFLGEWPEEEEENEDADLDATFGTVPPLNDRVAALSDADDETDDDDVPDAVGYALISGDAPIIDSAQAADIDDDEDEPDAPVSFTPPLNDSITGLFEIEPDEDEDYPATDFIAQQVAAFQASVDFIQAVLVADVDLEDDEDDGSYISLTTAAAAPLLFDFIAGPLEAPDDEFQDDDEVCSYAGDILEHYTAAPTGSRADPLRDERSTRPSDHAQARPAQDKTIRPADGTQSRPSQFNTSRPASTGGRRGNR